MPDKIAAGIVLLLPEAIAEEIIDINRDLLFRHPSDLMLNKTDCLPHVTLMQAVFKKTDLPKINSALTKIAKNQSHIILKGSLGQFNERIVGLKIEPSSQLQDLHQEVVDSLKVWSIDGPVKAEQYQGYDIDSSTLAYLENFSRMYAYEKFEPHITVGHGTAGINGRRLNFKTNHLAVCHLGSHNTCAEVLIETRCG